ncbi:Crp/Fnr family transcriptional regulator [Xenophilus azovorans]|uniref:Crp/Fnr family transcriptional regulator n=1 Tax=Xenophilus TaxID=151754 RepID=UPI00056E7047|nr:cyclic nucleotide-binding domain-containing protein [Xenophilus azovorans]
MPATIQDLCQAIAQNTSDDAFAPALQPAQWEVLGSYLQSFELAPTQTLIDEGAHDRSLFFVESGSLSVHRLSSKGEVQIAIVNAGSVVGEGSFFSRQPRSASVTAAGACRMWRLTPLRFSEMGNRQPGIALELAMALGLVLSRRLGHKARRVAVT